MAVPLGLRQVALKRNPKKCVMPYVFLPCVSSGKKVKGEKGLYAQ